MAAVTRAAPLLFALGARTASRASASHPRAFSRAAAWRFEPATFAARAQLTPRYRIRPYAMAHAAQNEAMPPKNGPVATKEEESERKLLLSAERATAAYKMSAVDAKARRIASLAAHCWRLTAHFLHNWRIQQTDSAAHAG